MISPISPKTSEFFPASGAGIPGNLRFKFHCISDLQAIFCPTEGAEQGIGREFCSVQRSPGKLRLSEAVQEESDAYHLPRLPM